MRVDIDYGLILRFTRDESGFFNLQPEPYGGPGAGSIAHEAVFPYGIYGLPLDADPTEAPTDAAVAAYSQPARLGAAGVTMQIGDETFILPASDPRIIPLLPNPGRGGVVYAGAYRNGETIEVTTLLIAGNDAGDEVKEGSVILTVKDGANAYKFEIDRLNREISITHPDDPTHPMLWIGPGAMTEIGGEPNAHLVIDTAGVFSAWVTAISAFANVPEPTGILSRVKARTLL
jgi:hypothetical protein